MNGTRRGHLGLFAYYYPPLGGAGSQRALSFARYLSGLGWRITVITPREGVYGRDPSLGEDPPEGVQVVRTESWEPAVLLRRLQGSGIHGRTSPVAGDFVEEAKLGPLGSALRGWTRRTLYFPDSSRGWIRSAVAAGLARHREDPFDLVLSSSPPVSAHVAARKVARAAGVPLVLDFRDLWPPTVIGEPRRAAVLLRGLLESATAVVTVSEGYAAWIRGFAPGTRVGVVYNGFEPGPAAAGKEAGEVGAADPPFLLHAGTTYPGRQDAGLLVEPLLALHGEGRPLQLRMAGRVDPVTRDRLAPLEKAGIATFPGFLPKAEVERMLVGACGILVWAWSGADPIGSGHLPAKLFEALKGGRPVILLANPGSEAEAVGGSVGIPAFDPSDKERLGRVFRSLAAGESAPDLLPDPGAAARFRRSEQARRLDGFLRTEVFEPSRRTGGGDGRRLAFFAYYYPPLGGAGSQRALSFTRHLANRGWRVTVFTPREGVYGRDASLGAGLDHEVRIERTGTWEPSVLLRGLRKGTGKGSSGGGGEFVDEVDLGRIGRTLRGLVRRTLYFPDSSRGWIGPALARARRCHRIRAFDAVLSSSPPVSAHVAAERFASETDLPWISDWRDIWTARLEAPPRLHARAVALERRLLREADGICAASGGFMDLLLDKRGEAAPHAVVRNGWVESDFPEEERAPVAQGVIVYAGTVYGRNQDLGAFLDAFRRVRAGSRGSGVTLRILGKIDEYTRDLVRRGGPKGGVEFTGFVTHERVLEEIKRATGLLLLGWKGEHEDARGIVPAKAYEYLASGRPILALTQPDSELAKIVGGCRGVTIAGFEEGKSMEEWIRSVGDGTAGEGPERSGVLAYRRSVQAALLEEVLEEVLARKESR